MSTDRGTARLSSRRPGIPVQTEPPSVPIARFFPSGKYPEGEIQQYKDECVNLWLRTSAPYCFVAVLCSCVCAARRAYLVSPCEDILKVPRTDGFRSQRWRTTDAECRERERIDADMYNDVRKASEIHRTVRKYIRGMCKPGVKLIDMCEVRGSPKAAAARSSDALEVALRLLTGKWLPRL